MPLFFCGLSVKNGKLPDIVCREIAIPRMKGDRVMERFDYNGMNEPEIEVAVSEEKKLAHMEMSQEISQTFCIKKGNPADIVYVERV